MEEINMTSSCIERRENRLRNISKEETLKIEKKLMKYILLQKNMQITRIKMMNNTSEKILKILKDYSFD